MPLKEVNASRFRRRLRAQVPKANQLEPDLIGGFGMVRIVIEAGG